MTSQAMSILSPARMFVQKTELPLAPTALEAVKAPAIQFTQEKQAITVGSQLVEFSPRANSQLKSSITNCILFAQLAANKVTEIEGDTLRWHAKYADTLHNLGWVMEDMNLVKVDVSDVNAELHEAIIPVITTLLGPQVAVASIILGVLKGLKEMDKDRPWITLLERESKRFKSVQFQVSYADVDQKGIPRISLLLLTLEATKVITQFLFFKFTDESAVLRKNTSTLSINLDILNMIQADLANRLRPYITSFIQEIPI